MTTRDLPYWPAAMNQKMAEGLSLPYWNDAISQRNDAPITSEEKAMLAADDKTKDRRFIYFVYAPQLDLVKVGHTSDLRKRYSELRSGNACELDPYFEIAAPRTLERIILRLLAGSISHHEWLHFDQRVESLIECIEDYDIWHNPERKPLSSRDVLAIIRCWQILIQDRGLSFEASKS